MKFEVGDKVILRPVKPTPAELEWFKDDNLKENHVYEISSVSDSRYLISIKGTPRRFVHKTIHFQHYIQDEDNVV